MRLRLAQAEDSVALARLDQDLGSGPCDSLFADLRRLEQDLTHPDRVWVVGEASVEVRAFATLVLDPALRLGKLARLRAAGSPQERREARAAAVGFLLERAAGRTDLIYSTTRTLTLEEQSATLEQGFHVLGVFPNAISADLSRLNGLTAWYAPGVLDARRHTNFSIHPAVEPFYELARRQCGFGPAAGVERPEPTHAGEGSPELELIEAPRFAAERFRRLRERKSLSVNFYPFQEPNAVFTSSDQSVEVFAATTRERRFANLIGERLSVAVDPVALYRRIASMLYDRNIHYLEVINDAADAAGIECLVRAGFSPCGYFPCLKFNGETRRDTVVFARSAEFFHYEPQPIDPRYEEFLIAFCRGRDTLPREGTRAALGPV